MALSLREWMFYHKMTYEKMADLVGCTSVYIGAIKTKRLIPHWRKAKKIYDITNGEVTLEELLGEVGIKRYQKKLMECRVKEKKAQDDRSKSTKSPQADSGSAARPT